MPGTSGSARRFTDNIEIIERIQRFAVGMDGDAFAANEQTVLAVKCSVLIVSEAAAKLGDIASRMCPDIPWREIRGVGNRLRHDYESIDIIRIWLLIERGLPPLLSARRTALRALEGNASP
jgi:uncharacterized protein with HEPN domain